MFAMPDYPRSLIAFQRRFGDDRACAEYLFSVRWPEGFRCPTCGHPKGWALETKAWTFQCAKCAKQTSVTAGTIMHGSKLALHVWFWAAYLMATHSNGISAMQLWKQLGLGSYKSAWLLAAKLRRAMVDAERNPLSGLVEIDETTINHRTRNDPPAGAPGRSHQGKLLIAGAVEIEGQGPGRIRLAHLRDYSADSLHAFIGTTTTPGTVAKTDGWSAYPGAPGGPATTPTSSAPWPPISSCRGSTASSPTSRHGRSASTTACAASTCNPTSTSSSSASTAAAPATPPSTPSSESACKPSPLPTRC